MIPVIYEDDHYIAVNKPHGLMIHKSALSRGVKEFLVNILEDQIGQKVYPVHRLDRKTSGVILFAKSSEATKLVGEQFQNKTTKKEYLAIVRGHFIERVMVTKALENDKGVIQEAETEFICVSKSTIDIPVAKYPTARFSLVKCKPKTGRMHQIRKHLNHLRFPIIGDRPHGCNKNNKMLLEKFGLEKMMLHAKELTFYHPFTKENITLNAELSSEFNRMLDELKLVK